MGIFVNKRNKHEKKIRKLYKNRGVFLHTKNEQQINNTLTSLADIYGYNLEQCDYIKYREILDSYEIVAIRKFMYDYPLWITIQSLQESCQDLIPNKDIALKAALFSHINYANDNYSLANKEDRENFEFCYAVASGSFPLNPDTNLQDRILEFDVDMTIDEDQSNFIVHKEGYYFGNVYEYVAYVCSENPKKDVVWRAGSVYSDIYSQAYQELDSGNLERAKELYIKSMKYNPVAISARFELVEICKKMHSAKDAVMILNSAFKYLFRERDIAGFYRKYAYIAIDLNQPYLASALLQYSMNFEKNPMVQNELKYLKRYESESDDYINVDIESEFKKHHIPKIIFGESAMKLAKQIEEIQGK